MVAPFFLCSFVEFADFLTNKYNTLMKKLLLMAAVAFAFAACGNSNSNKEAGCCETKAAEHVCNHGEGHKCTKAEGEHKCNHESGEHKCNHENGEHKCNHQNGEHKCNHAADSTKHECNHKAEGEHKCNHENGECNQPADKQCDACKEAAAKKAAAEQAQ